MNLDANQRASQAQFDRQAALYGRVHILSDVADIERALRDLALSECGPALDVATGAGHTAVYLAGRGLDVTATDLAPAMLEQTEKLASERGVKIRTAPSAAEALPGADGGFGLVTCRVAAHHFSSVSAFLREAHRALRPGGWLLVIDGAAPDGAPAAEEWLHQVEKLRDPSHGRFLTPSRWLQLAGEAGFEMSRCECTPFKQPDVAWYFRTAATSPDNRARVLDLIEHAPEEARRAFRLGREDGRIVWWWQRMSLLARRRDQDA